MDDIAPRRQPAPRPPDYKYIECQESEQIFPFDCLAPSSSCVAESIGRNNNNTKGEEGNICWNKKRREREKWRDKRPANVSNNKSMMNNWWLEII